MFPDTDLSPLALLRRLNSARVATWCLGSRHPETHEHGEIHLSLLRQPSDDFAPSRDPLKISCRTYPAYWSRSPFVAEQMI